MRGNSRFQPGIGNAPGGVYECYLCHRKTRDTGYGESSVGLCRFCYEEAETENEFSDETITEEEYRAKLADIDRRRVELDKQNQRKKC